MWSPIIKCDFQVIGKNLDDICAVDADTWILSTAFNELIEFHHKGGFKVGIVNQY